MRWLCGVAVVFLLAGIGRAQEQPTPEQLKKMYDGALQQLEIANNRKNDLAKENEQLKGQLEEQKKQQGELRAQLEQLKQEQDQWAEKTFFYRAHYSAWARFIQRYPKLAASWKAFMEKPMLEPPFEALNPDEPPPAAATTATTRP